MRVFSVECPRVNSNYRFLQDYSRPEKEKEESHGWLTTIPLMCTRAHKNTSGSQVWIQKFPLRVRCHIYKSLEICKSDRLGATRSCPHLLAAFFPRRVSPKDAPSSVWKTSHPCLVTLYEEEEFAPCRHYTPVIPQHLQTHMTI